jgi:hypothetical protein
MATFYEIYQNYLQNPYGGVNALPGVNAISGTMGATPISSMSGGDGVSEVGSVSPVGSVSNVSNVGGFGNVDTSPKGIAGLAASAVLGGPAGLALNIGAQLADLPSVSQMVRNAIAGLGFGGDSTSTGTANATDTGDMGSEAANNAATDAANASAGVGDGGGPGGGDSGDTGGPFRDGGRVGLYDGGSAFDNYRALNLGGRVGYAEGGTGPSPDAAETYSEYKARMLEALRKSHGGQKTAYTDVQPDGSSSGISRDLPIEDYFNYMLADAYALGFNPNTGLKFGVDDRGVLTDQYKFKQEMADFKKNSQTTPTEDFSDYLNTTTINTNVQTTPTEDFSDYLNQSTDATEKPSIPYEQYVLRTQGVPVSEEVYNASNILAPSGDLGGFTSEQEFNKARDELANQLMAQKKTNQSSTSSSVNGYSAYQGILPGYKYNQTFDSYMDPSGNVISRSGYYNAISNYNNSQNLANAPTVAEQMMSPDDSMNQDIDATNAGIPDSNLFQKGLTALTPAAQLAKGILGIGGTPITQSMETAFQDIIQNQIKETGNLSGDIDYKDYGVQNSSGAEYLGLGDKSITDPKAALALTLGRASYAVDPQTGKVNLTGGTDYNFEENQLPFGLGTFINKGGIKGFLGLGAKEATQYAPNISVNPNYIKQTYQAERPLQSAFERFTGAAGPLAENINTAISSLNPFQKQQYMNYAVQNPDQAIAAAQRNKDFLAATQKNTNPATPAPASMADGGRVFYLQGGLASLLG